MPDSLRHQLAWDERGLTLAELLVVVIVMGVLLAIALPSYLGSRDDGEQKVMQSDVRAMLPSVESFYSDFGAFDADPPGAETTMSDVYLKATYDQSIDTTVVDVTNQSPSDYCVRAAGSKFTAWKRGPSGTIQAAENGDASICS